MTTSEKIRLAIREPRQIGRAFMQHTAKCWHNDELYLKLLFYFTMGKRLDLKHPKTFNEKLQWLKLYNRRPEYTTMVDKYAVKDYVADKIGKEYIIPTLGVWDKPEQIEWDKLPNQFVLKTTHGGGNSGVVICKDKSTFNREQAIAKLNRSLQSDIYVNFREWPYKNVPKRIIAEEYIEDSRSKELVDYKFFCFDGYVDSVMVCLDRQEGDTKFYFFDSKWQLKRYDIYSVNVPNDFTLSKPIFVDEMFNIAEKLSAGIPHARVDLYSVDGHIYFGEITLFSASGMDLDLLPTTDLHFGNLINIV